MNAMPLKQYQSKRRFSETPEPRGKSTPKKKGKRFCVQKHAASHVHFDFRVEINGVLKSWAVPKGPSMNPSDKRMALLVEDHPLDYLSFEGYIPQGNYGAGKVIVWDIGTFQPLTGKSPAMQFKQGVMHFVLEGKKLRGEFTLIKTGKEKQWLLIKKSDQYISKQNFRLNIDSALSHSTLLDKRESHPEHKKKMPAFFSPMLATLVDEAFDDKGWDFELKWDGYRALAFIDKKTHLFSRRGILYDRKYPEILEAVSFISERAILDGEIIALDEKGKPSFQLLQNPEKPKALQYIVFDLLFLHGKDLRTYPYRERRNLLESILPKHDPRLVLSPVVERAGKKLLKESIKRGFEGVIGKKNDSIYVPGKRSAEWVKVKTTHRQEAVIGGFTRPKGSRKGFGSLLLGIYKKHRLIYAGNCGTGFDDRLIQDLHRHLEKVVISQSPFADYQHDKNAVWVKPKLLCEVKFTEWTKEGKMRHPVFIGLRQDKPAKEVNREQPKQRNTKRTFNFLTHQDKVFWPEEGYTKGDLLAYYQAVHSFILPYLRDRPLSMLRHPNGIKGKSFFQKNVEYDVPDFMETRKIRSEHEGRAIRYLIANNLEALLYVVNLGCIELNPWNSRIESLDHPDYLIIDIDPSTNGFKDVVQVAKTARKVLDEACVESYCKTSGKRGLHVLVPMPMGAAYTYEQTRVFAELLANVIHAELPGLTSVERSPAKRKGKIYLDFLQNRKAQTLASPYCARPWPGATVSAPLEWKEVNSRLNPAKFTIKTMPDRLKRRGDLWEGMLEQKTDLDYAVSCLERYLKKRRS